MIMSLRNEKKVSLVCLYLLCLSFLEGQLAIIHGDLVITDLEFESAENAHIVN